MICVIMPTVQWRWESSGLAAVRAVAQQPADKVVVYAHGFDPTEDVRDLPTVDLRVYAEVRPSGCRWEALATLQDDDIVLSLDDDFVLAPSYVEHTVAALERLGGAVAWYGMQPPGHDGVDWTTNRDVDLPLISLGTGMCATYVRYLRGMCEHRDAARVVFSREGDEEGFVSWWLYTQKQTIWRPAGLGPLVAHPNQWDKRASLWTYSKYIAQWRPYLRKTYGWPWAGLGWPQER